MFKLEKENSVWIPKKWTANEIPKQYIIAWNFFWTKKIGNEFFSYLLIFCELSSGLKWNRKISVVDWGRSFWSKALAFVLRYHTLFQKLKNSSKTSIICIEKKAKIFRGNLELWVTTFLPDRQPPLIFVQFISNFLCVCSSSMFSRSNV